MLKERIDYLWKKKGISRKELVEGFVTTAHFANILAERYPLPEDLAGHLAQRLQVPPTYLLEAGNTDQDTLETANRIFEELSQAASLLSEERIHDLPDRHDCLTVELTVALMKAIYYQQVNDAVSHDYLHQNYLNFYLEKYGRPDDAELPLPAKKAMLFYKIQFYRSKNRYHEALSHANRLSEYVREGTDLWLTTQNFKMEASIFLKLYDQAKQVFDGTMRRVYEERLFHRLTDLYIAYSGYCYSMGLYQEALVTLSMAEANLVYAVNQGNMLSTIMNNRIIMLTMQGEHEKAEEEIRRFAELLERESAEVREQFRPILLIYRCESAAAQKQWGLLTQYIQELKSLELTTDQEMSAFFYQCQLALAHGHHEEFMEYALKCLPYYESAQLTMRLESLYEALAAVSEESRKYKESTVYYKKLVYLLRNK
ncbi:XRE family transcriptional regulator [Paenibacillus sp. FSL H8-0457]|uniref:hypothetical protein n=1 Tax=unclassified Paenibacillus TaxID=185978 RepID=UPI0003E27C1B|nr:hypothetical protein [Paenibacillus sp. FSL H8-457]ETT67111.1 hypothetical protein C172_08484 [Paenibacillus sp. FSL H8-457]